MTLASSPRPADKPPYKAMLFGALVIGTLFAVWMVRRPPPESRLPMILHTGQTMATTYSVKVVTDDRHPSVRSRIAKVVERELKFVNDAMSHYQGDSDISRFNRAQGNEPVPVSAALATLIAQSKTLYQQSERAFDVTITPLVRLWGFEDKEGRSTAPSDEELAQTLRIIGIDKVAVDAEHHTLTKTRDGVEIDLSAIAKGYAVDRVALALEELGYHNYLVEIGGEVRTGGISSRQSPWRVAIERPDRQARQVYKVIEMSNQSMATSGDYRSFYRLGEKLLSHTIDPQTGRPVDHDLASVTVVHPSCATADAWATALNVLGARRGLAIAEKQGLAAFFITRNEDGALTTTATTRFKPLLEQQNERRP